MEPSMRRTAKASLTCICTLLSCALDVTSRSLARRARISSRAKSRTSFCACRDRLASRAPRRSAWMMRFLVWISSRLTPAMSRSSLRMLERMMVLHFLTWQPLRVSGQLSLSLSLSLFSLSAPSAGTEGPRTCAWGSGLAKSAFSESILTVGWGAWPLTYRSLCSHRRQRPMRSAANFPRGPRARLT